MKWPLMLIFALLMIGNVGGPASETHFAAAGVSRVKGTPLRDVAAPLREAWLRFHEAGLCLDIDAVFVFHARRLEIWCRTKDERSSRKLATLVEPLRKSFQIELYAARADREAKAASGQDEDPPPSLWTNAELRLFLRDPLTSRIGMETEPETMAAESNAHPQLKRHLKLYVDQILEWEAKMVRLATDLPALASAGYGDDLMPEIRNRARAVCLEHAREVGKCAARLAESLSRALPQGAKKAATAPNAPRAQSAAASPYDHALLVAGQAQETGSRIMRFLYPQAHTVTLADLRHPSLIDELRALQKAVSDFESSARKSR
jgi:hypothetical protein